jgi:alcohol oxidase
MGVPEIKDLQNLDENNGLERWLRYVNQEGKRQDTAHTYLHPKLEDGQHPNLHVLVESKVVRVLFDETKRAVGVEYTPNPEFQAVIGLTAHPVKTVKARKLVVVTCGACGTPPVLERSGLGDSKILARAGVPVVEELRGVGKDHILSGRTDAAELIKNKDKVLGWNAIDISSKLRPTDEEVTALGPKFKQAWDRDFKEIPNRPLMLCGVIQW